MKKTNIMFVSLISLAYAEDKAPFTGGYVGGSAGGFLLGGDFDFSDGANQGKLKAKKIGMSAGGFVGYMKLSDNKAWFAGEAYFSMKSGKETKKMQAGANDLGTVVIQSKPIFGGALLIGAAVNPKLVVYAKAAYEYATYSFSFSGLTSGATTTYSEQKKISNVIPTAGALYRLTDNMLVGLEGGYVISTKKISIDFAPYSTSFKPTEYRGSLTLRYVF